MGWGIELDFTQRSLCEDVDKIIVIIRSDYLKIFDEFDENVMALNIVESKILAYIFETLHRLHKARYFGEFDLKHGSFHCYTIRASFGGEFLPFVLGYVRAQDGQHTFKEFYKKESFLISISKLTMVGIAWEGSGFL